MYILYTTKLILSCKLTIIRYVPTLLTWIDLANNKGRLLQVFKKNIDFKETNFCAGNVRNPACASVFSSLMFCNQNTVIEKWMYDQIYRRRWESVLLPWTKHEILRQNFNGKLHHTLYQSCFISKLVLEICINLVEIQIHLLGNLLSIFLLIVFSLKSALNFRLFKSARPEREIKGWSIDHIEFLLNLTWVEE